MGTLMWGNWLQSMLTGIVLRIRSMWKMTLMMMNQTLKHQTQKQILDPAHNLTLDHHHIHHPGLDPDHHLTPDQIVLVRILILIVRAGVMILVLHVLMVTRRKMKGDLAFSTSLFLVGSRSLWLLKLEKDYQTKGVQQMTPKQQ